MVHPHHVVSHGLRCTETLLHFNNSGRTVPGAYGCERVQRSRPTTIPNPRLRNVQRPPGQSSRDSLPWNETVRKHLCFHLPSGPPGLEPSGGDGGNVCPVPIALSTMGLEVRRLHSHPLYAPGLSEHSDIHVQHHTHWRQLRAMASMGRRSLPSYTDSLGDPKT